MTIELRPLSDAVGVEALGVAADGNLADADARTLQQAFLEHGLVLVRGLEMDTAQHVELTRLFGHPEIHPIESIRHPEQPEIIVLSANPPEDLAEDDPAGDEIVGRIPWHTDLTYRPTPSRGALLYAVEVPPDGGRTGYADTAAIYDALPEDTKRRIEGLEVLHEFSTASKLHQKQQMVSERYRTRDAGGDKALQMPEFPPVIHPLVREHPVTGRRALIVSPLFASHIVNLPEGEDGNLLDELKDFAMQEDRFAYFHDWRPGDVLIWDNWRTMHTATGYKRRHRRRMHRTTLGGEVTFGRIAE